MKNIKILNTLLLLTSISLLVGCGGGGGGGSNPFGNTTNPDNTQSSQGSYYNSANYNINNLASTDKIYSSYNGQNNVEIKNIPVDSSNDVLYSCLITNPTGSDITDFTITPPLTYNIRANEILEDINYLDSAKEQTPIMPFRENLDLKAKLKEELYQKYLENEVINKRSATRLSVNHLDEKEGQNDIIIKVLGRNRYCSFVKESKYGKFFIDQDKDGPVLPQSIPNESLQQFANEFDNYIYPILKEYFGNGSNDFWRDIDNDKKLSIVFSPVVNNYGNNVVGIFDTSSLNDRNNPRDMISIAVKSGENTTYEKWFTDARETIAHEMQHIVNFSAKSHSEETWIDEGLAVCAEILYRQKRREAGLMAYSMYYGENHLDFEGNDARFYYASYYMPELSITSFKSTQDNTEAALAHYGQKGLFFYYLYEQYGKELLRQLCQGQKGYDKFNTFDRSLEELAIDFNFASLNEKLRHLNFTSFEGNPYNLASSKHKFKTDFNLNFIYTQYGFVPIDGSYMEQRFIQLNSPNSVKILKNQECIPANGGTIRFFLKQPKDFSNIIHSNYYTLTFNSSKPFIINMVRASK